MRRALARPSRSRELAGIEGPNLLEEAVRAGLRVECVFAAEGAEELLEALDLPPGTEIVRRAQIAAGCGADHRNAAAGGRAGGAAGLDLGASFATERGRTALVVVLAGLQDPGNVGTILRSAEAFGATGVVSLPGTVSAWNPKAVRASAGSVFRVPLLAADERRVLREACARRA